MPSPAAKQGPTKRLGRQNVASDLGGGGRARQRTDLYRRAFDVAVSAVLIPLTLPVLFMVVVGSAISLRAWPFFTQERIGRHGETFRFLKVRTLSPSVPSYIDKHELAEHSIPPFCQMLRTLHLDELPQLFLVLRGRMSLVGPRPEMGWLHDRMQPQFADLRTAVRPGCTGLWQVSDAHSELISASPEYDRFYLSHRTLRFDLWVLTRTALKMTGLSRCVSIGDVPAWVMPRATRIEMDLDAAAHEAPLRIPMSVGR
jgi:lipopolysaccharide/colanic/teichoic acid biosynthesis glycosyltransferase